MNLGTFLYALCNSTFTNKLLVKGQHKKKETLISFGTFPYALCKKFFILHFIPHNKVFVCVKTIMSVQRVSILLWKYFLAKEEGLFYCWKVSKILLASLFASARRVDACDVSKFRVENKAIMRLRLRKLIFLLFSKIKGFFARTVYFRFGFSI